MKEKLRQLWQELSFRFALLLGILILAAVVEGALAAALPLDSGALALLYLLTLLVWGAAGWALVYRPQRGVEKALLGSEPKKQAQVQSDENRELLSAGLMGREIVRLRNQTDSHYNSWMLEKQTELDSLQSQINPHFLYNTLESIRGKAAQQNAQDIADMTEALANFFRYSISLRENVVTLGEELENARNYFNIQQFRFDSRFTLNIKEKDPALLLNCRMPKLTLQPIIENAIYHGLEPKMGRGSVTIDVVSTQYNTLVLISDDGLGIDEEPLAALQSRIETGQGGAPRAGRGGIALPNVHRRIQLTFGQAYGLQVTSTLGLGTDVEIILPPWREPDDAM